MLPLFAHVLSFEDGTAAGYQPHGITAGMCIDTKKGLLNSCMDYRGSFVSLSFTVRQIFSGLPLEISQRVDARFEVQHGPFPFALNSMLIKCYPISIAPASAIGKKSCCGHA